MIKEIILLVQFYYIIFCIIAAIALMLLAVKQKVKIKDWLFFILASTIPIINIIIFILVIISLISTKYGVKVDDLGYKKNKYENKIIMGAEFTNEIIDKGIFIENVVIDAELSIEAAKSGVDGILAYADKNRAIFPNSQSVLDRCNWVLKKNKKYRAAVSAKASEIMINKSK